jgi:dethiobiotin synthetase
MSGVFVTGTDTGVGKTVLAAAIVAALRARGRSVTVLKPVITGLDEPTAADWPADHELLARVAGTTPERVALAAYGPAVSPHLAAELAGRPVDVEALLAAVRSATRDADTLVVEGVGGLLVPIAIAGESAVDVRALARAIGLPVLIAARCGLGTINHTLLTLEAARAGALMVAGVVLTPWPASPGVIERSNLRTIESLGRVRMATLAPVARPEPELLAAAGAALPLDSWLS